MDDNVNSRRRGAWLGLLTVLLVALASAGYAASSSPSASTGVPGKTSSTVLAPAASSNTANNGSGGSGNGNCLDPASESTNCVHSFGVTVGQTGLLYPGVARSLPVTFTNPNNFDIYITSYRVSVTVPSGSAACASSSLQVPIGTATLNPNLTAPKSSSVTKMVSITLPANVSEGCKNVRFSITVNASAVKK